MKVQEEPPEPAHVHTIIADMAFESVRSEIQDVQDNYYDLIELSDFGIWTWLSFGAIFQLLCLAYLPPRVAALPPPHNTLQLAPKGSTHMFSRMGRRSA